MGKDKGRIKEGEERDEKDEGRNTDKKTTKVEGQRRDRQRKKYRAETDRGRQIKKIKIELDTD